MINKEKKVNKLLIFLRNQLANTFIILSAIINSIVEIFLLEKKYNIFTCGFLQKFCFPELNDQILAILAIFYFNFSFALFFNGFIYLAFNFTKKRINLTFSVKVFFLTILTYNLIVFTKYQILKYFNDIINYNIIKRWAGNKFENIIYFSYYEILIFASSIIIIFSFIFIAYKIILTYINKIIIKENIIKIKNLKIGLFVNLFISLFFIIIISSNPKWFYLFRKVSSFSIIANLLNKATDWDLDSFGIIINPIDKEPFNCKIFPGAVDIPNNGIDEDQLAGDLKKIIIEQDVLKKIKPDQGKHILLIILESVRYDVLTKKINGKYVAPNLRNLAQNGKSIPFAYSHTGFTISSIKSIFNRSLLANSHKIRFVDFLIKSGYKISVFSGQDESFGGMARETGLQQYANYFFDARSALEKRIFPSRASGSLALRNETVLSKFEEVIVNLNWKRPQFIYINLQAAHFPYYYDDLPLYFKIKPLKRNEIRPSNHERLIETYWNAVAHNDWAIGKIVNLLKKEGRYDEFVIAITSDHGESLFDDNFLGHGHAINDQQTRIPFIVNSPGINIMEPIGTSEFAEILISIAFGLPINLNNSEKFVFQIVGGIERPALIGGVYKGGNRLVLDLQTKMLYNSVDNKWQFLNRILDPLLQSRVNELIFYWESLNWQRFSNLKKPQKECFIFHEFF